MNADFQRLTPRERDVIELIVAGKSNKEIAVELAISYKHTGKLIESIFAKLEAHSRTEAAVAYVRWALGAREGHAPGGELQGYPLSRSGSTVRRAFGSGPCCPNGEKDAE